MRRVAWALCSVAIMARGVQAQGALTNADSGVVRAILLAEDQRDSTSAAIADGLRHRDPRVQVLARRAAARIRDAKFASRDSFPALPAPPAYTDPAWRLRYRALVPARVTCAELRVALADSNWAVRLRAADLVAATRTPDCSGDSVVVATLRAWATRPVSTSRAPGDVSWHAAGHALVGLARIAPSEAREALARFAASPTAHLRAYAARVADAMSDSAVLLRLAADRDDNVKEIAMGGLSRVAGHSADDVFIAGVSSAGYQAVRAAAMALARSPRGRDVFAAALAAAQRIKRVSSETSRDARTVLMARIDEFAVASDADAIMPLTQDFDCTIARAAANIVTKLRGAPATPSCTPLPVVLPAEATALALGKVVEIRVTMAPASGGGSFIVRLRGDAAPIMASRVLALVRSGYYSGRPWHRVEPDFVTQGGGGGNEYVGHPRFMRDELGGVPHARGTIGMSTRGHDTGDAQWFFNLRDNFRLNADYTVFAEVVDGIDVVDQILEGDLIQSMVVIP